MIVSLNWLKDYVSLEMPLGELTERLTMSGLNLEGIEEFPGDTAIDLEVTSNRPDCNGHIGVAREISALWGVPLQIPNPQPGHVDEATDSATSVEIDCPELCPRYIARVIRGVKVGPSPDWLIDRLQTLGLSAVNNIVDITNYVMMEFAQPLHAFDFARLSGQRIVVRKANPSEKLEAIDHETYDLSPEMCVIADDRNPVAIAGVMGGAATEISEGTVDVLIEAADFAPLSVRNTARKLKLFSDSSYRFERGVDAQNIDTASSRCCELILEIAGGELLAGSARAGEFSANESPAIELRHSQLSRVLGIDVPRDESRRILESLGLSHSATNNGSDQYVAPSWRPDLVREIDLVEEVARIHGYDKIPEDDALPTAATSRSNRDRVAARIRNVMTAAGISEAITLSFTNATQARLFSSKPDQPMVGVEDAAEQKDSLLRQSLIPGLIEARRENERFGVMNAELFEIAKVFYEADPTIEEETAEPTMIGLVSGRGYRELLGVMQRLAGSISRDAIVTAKPTSVSGFTPGRGAILEINGEFWGWIGEIDRTSDCIAKLKLRDDLSAAEVRRDVLENICELTPHYRPLPQFPGMTRDVSLILEESVSWQAVSDVIAGSAGPLFEGVSFAGQYRGEQLPTGKKSYLASIEFRSRESTLTGEEVDGAMEAVLAACGEQLGATLRV